VPDSATVTFQCDHAGVAQQSIQKCCGRCWLVEETAPILEVKVARDDQRPMFVCLSDQLKQVVGTGSVELYIPQFIENKSFRSSLFMVCATYLRLMHCRVGLLDPVVSSMMV
jgi:hypothetical protein